MSFTDLPANSHRILDEAGGVHAIVDFVGGKVDDVRGRSYRVPPD